MKAGQLEKGMYILYKNNEPFLVQEREFVNPGKGAAFVRCKLKGLFSKQIVRETIKSQDTIDIADVTHAQGQYLYEDGQYFHFMETQSFEQYAVSIADFEGHKYYLREGETYRIVFFDTTIVDVVLPPKVALTVVEAAEALKGDTATSVTKTVRCDTDARVKVPGFIKEGEKILVNTDTGEYVERAN